MISVLAARPALRAGVLAGYILLVEWTRALVSTVPGVTVAALVLGGVALAIAVAGWLVPRPAWRGGDRGGVPRPAWRGGDRGGAETLGLGTSRIGLRILGGLALAIVLLLPAAARASAAPILPASLALAAVVVSIGEELAFRGALYAALDEIGGAPLAVAGSTVAWTAAHALSHPPAFLGAVAAAGLLLGLWRWACRDLVAPIIGHVIADLAL